MATNIEAQTTISVVDKKIDLVLEFLIENGIDIDDDFLKYIKQFKEYKKIYQTDQVIKKLIDFGSPHHLEKYIESVYEINKIPDTGSERYFKMDHILYKIIKQNYIALYNLLSYQFSTKTIKDLFDSYTESIFLQKNILESLNISGEKERLAWFINLKNPSTFYRSNDVKNHYSAIIENFYKIDKVDLRRIHIFYNEYFLDENILQLKKAFSIMFFENLIGINNKLVNIINVDSIKEKVYFEGNRNNNFANVFLLDYALFQYPRLETSNSCIDYDLHLLPAEFALEEIITNKQDAQAKAEEYPKQRVFHLNGPHLFYIFKKNYLSFWNKDRYVKSIDELLRNKIYDIFCKQKNTLLEIILDTDFIEKFRELLSGKSVDNEFINTVRQELVKSKIEINSEIKVLKRVVNEVLRRHFLDETIEVIEADFIAMTLDISNKVSSHILKDLPIESEIFSIRDIFYRNIEVLDFFTFCRRVFVDYKVSPKSFLSETFYYDKDRENGMSNYFKILGIELVEDYENPENRKKIISEIVDELESFVNNVLIKQTDINKIRNSFISKFDRYIINTVK